MTHRPLSIVALLTLAACTRQPEPPAAPPPPLTPASPHGQLPAGHPPMHGGAGAAPAPASARELRWSDPVGWRRVTPSSSMRRAQYAVPGPGGEAEVTVFYFGTGQGGSVEDNLRRWHGQFEVATGTPPPPADERRTAHGLTVHVTRRNGRYTGMAMPGGGAASAHDDYALLGAIVETPEGPWFFKMTGPRTTVEAAGRGFDDLVASFQMP